MQDKNLEQLEAKRDGLAIEIFSQLKKTIIAQWIIILILIALLAATHFYHIYQWSQFDTIVVDSGEGGYANYVDGENTGGIYNGEGYSAQAQENQQKQVEGNKN